MMYRLALTAFAGLLAQALLAQTQQVSLVTTTQIGPHGSFCEPFQCKPHYTAAGPGEFVRFDIGGAPATPFVLFAGSSVTGCQPIPGVANGLAAWAPITAIAIGLINDTAPPASRVAPPPTYPCMPGTAAMEWMVPAGAVFGTDVRFQVLGVSTYAKPGRLEFSRAVEIRIH
jgi:hypothetical protein